MADQTVASLSTTHGSAQDLNFSPNERRILSELAQQVAELAARPIEAEKRTLWYTHNALESTRALIFCDPENGWNEIITEDQILCENELAKSWEMTLRKEIFWGESMGDDRVIAPYFDVPYTYSESSWGLEKTIKNVMAGGSYVWDAPIKEYSDMERLKFPEIIVDYETTNKVVELAKDVVGDFLPVRLKGVWWWTLGLTWTLIDLRGLEQFMLDMYDHPDELHQLLAFLRDGHLAKLDFLEQHDLLDLNNDSTYVGSGGFGWTNELPQADFDGSHVRTMDMWGFTESQETVRVSPKMVGEFVFPYQRPLQERFGLNCYGCCEALDKRWHHVEKIPRLRRVSVSAWANVEDMAEKLGAKYIFSWKPSPTPLSRPKMDEDEVRKSIRDTLQATRNCRVELIMKDNHTIGNNPDNVIRWCQIAREEVNAL